MGSLVRGVLVHGMELFEHAFPMPARLGMPLAPGRGARRDADPVVLVSGFANTPTGWDEWRRSLVADGFDVHVFDMPSRGLGDMRVSARQLAAFVEEVRRRTGRRRVDLVGFSEGGLLARMVVSMHGGAAVVDRLVSLATPHAGVRIAARLYHRRTFLSGIVDGIVAALGQLFEGSELLGAIERADAPLRDARDGVRYASIYANGADPLVLPTSAHLAGALNIPVASDRPGGRTPTHFDMYHLSDRAYEAGRALLLDQPDAVAVAHGGVVGQAG